MTSDDKGRETEAIPTHGSTQGVMYSLPKPGKYWCKLCRESGIKSRNSHLRNKHGAHPRLFNKRKDDALLEAIFLESVQ